jgi:hypothetical protein
MSFFDATLEDDQRNLLFLKNAGVTIPDTETGSCAFTHETWIDPETIIMANFGVCALSLLNINGEEMLTENWISIKEIAVIGEINDPSQQMMIANIIEKLNNYAQAFPSLHELSKLEETILMWNRQGFRQPVIKNGMHI